MLIIVPPALTDWSVVKAVQRSTFLGLEGFRIGTEPATETAYWLLSWGRKRIGAWGGVMETGFFWDGIHIDRYGLYQNSSLATAEGVKAIDEFTPPYSAVEKYLRSSMPHSKYRQTDNDQTWDGVVLAAQNPADRSVQAVCSTGDYWRWVKSVCRNYKKHLFIKLHPWNSGDVLKRYQELAKEYGCSIGKTNHSVISNCRFVILWNSSFAVDCFMRGVNVVQCAPGYFWQTKAVLYAEGLLPSYPGDTINEGYKLAEFLLHRYCFNMAMPESSWIELLKIYAYSHLMFPLPPHLSYAAFIDAEEKNG